MPLSFYQEIEIKLFVAKWLTLKITKQLEQVPGGAQITAVGAITHSLTIILVTSDIDLL